METERLALSTSLLRSVLAGKTYDAAAREHGITRTAVERRVKSLVLALVRDGGVEGLSESQVLFVRKLREHRDRIEAAVAQFAPAPDLRKEASPLVLSQEEVQIAVRRARLHTATPERDVAMVLILLATGLRPLEVARLEVRDYLREDGSVKVESALRAEASLNQRARPLFFSSTVATQAIDEYLRARRLLAPVGPARYGGLDPSAALFLNEAGCRFVVQVRSTGSGTRSLCQEIHYAYRKIFRRIGMPGLSALQLRHTVMDRLIRRGADEGQIGELLGIREPRPLKRERLRLDQLMQELI